MKKFILAICVCMAVGMMVVPASAEEIYDFHLRGITEGLAAGAVPPPGFYFVNDIFFAPSWKAHGVTDNNGIFNASEANSNVKLMGTIFVPALLYNPGCKVLGADYMMAIIQPWDGSDLRVGVGEPHSLAETGNQWGTYNTIIVPFKLSWKIPCDLRVSAALAIGIDDAWNSPKDSVAAHPDSQFNPVAGAPFANQKIGNFKLVSAADGNPYAWSGNGDWSFNPEVGISWLHAGWNLSAGLGYTFWTKDGSTNYQSGGQFFGDYTATYTCGKWTFGLGAQTEIQTESDKFNALTFNAAGIPNGTTGYQSQPNTRNENYSMGPIIGYNFGPCSITFVYNFELQTKNDLGGDWFDFRLVVPLGNPYGIGK